jgi:hypothetical protein
MEQGMEPSDLPLYPFREYATLLQLVRVEVNEVSIQVLSMSYRL